MGQDHLCSIPGCYSVQTGSAAHPASYPMCVWALSPRVNWLGREADHSPPSSAEVKNGWSCTSSSSYIFVAWCLIKRRIGLKHRDSFMFNFQPPALNKPLTSRKKNAC